MVLPFSKVNFAGQISDREDTEELRIQRKENVTIFIIALSLVFVFLLYLYFRPKRKNLNEWANFATIAGNCATAGALLWAAYTFYESSRIQRELKSTDLYQEHLKLTAENPLLFNRTFSRQNEIERKEQEGSISLDELKEMEKDKTSYQWYVAHALYSFEMILETTPEDEEWKHVAKDFIQSQRNYIGSDQFPCNFQTPPNYVVAFIPASR
jgi:cbb3-type cytochrome oxidase subunit 3